MIRRDGVFVILFLLSAGMISSCSFFKKETGPLNFLVSEEITVAKEPLISEKLVKQFRDNTSWEVISEEQDSAVIAITIPDLYETYQRIKDEKTVNTDKAIEEIENYENLVLSEKELEVWAEDGETLEQGVQRTVRQAIYEEANQFMCRMMQDMNLGELTIDMSQGDEKL